ncbi:RIKEN cDNA 2310005O14, partial [hydrothermal vent metagenome]
MPASLPADPTLDEVREYLAPGLAAQAAFDGWNEKAVMAAAELTGVDPAIARLAFNDGAMDMIDAWFVSIDVAMAKKLPPEKLDKMKIRERITA